MDVSPTRSASCPRISGRLTERAKLNPQTPGSGRERFQIKARHPKCCSKAWISRLRPEGSFIKAHEFGPRGAELVKAGVGGRASGVRNRPKTQVPDGNWPAATNRDISAGFGAVASVRRARHATKKTTTGQSWCYKRRRGLVRARRRRHELAHHDGIRVPGDFRVDLLEAEFPV